MNTNNIYDAISGFDEKYISAADNTDAVSISFRKHQNHKLKIVETICACAALIITTGWINSQNWFGKNPVVTQTGIAVSDSTAKTEPPRTEQTPHPPTTFETEKHTQAYTTVSPVLQEHSTQAPQTDTPSTTKKTENPITTSAEPSSTVATTIVNHEGQQNVYKDVVVGYDTAKAHFGHQIVTCDKNDFVGYSVLLVTPKGNNNESKTDCLSVTYLFTNGSVVLKDQDKTGKVTPTGKQYDYCGKIFYVHTPEFNGDNIRIGYYPTEETGIAYQAHFNSNTDINEIMDLILSLELKN